MQAYMTGHTYGYDVQPMLWGIGCVVVLFCGLAAALTEACRGWRKALFDSISDGLMGFSFIWVQPTEPPQSPCHRLSARLRFRISSTHLLASLSRNIVPIRLPVAILTPRIKTVGFVLVCGELRRWLNRLALGAGGCYALGRHGLFSYKRLCSGPIAGYTPFSARSIIAVVILLSISFSEKSKAANEIHAFLPGITNAYAMIRGTTGTVWYPTGQVLETWGTSGRTAANYSIAMVDKSGDFFVGDFDTNVSAGAYYISVSNRVGGAPADTDPVLWESYGEWSGTVWSLGTPGVTADKVWDEAVSAHTTETSFGGELGGLDPNLALVLADTAELQTDWTNGGRLDLLLDAVKAITDRLVLVTTTVASATDANDFVLTAGTDVNDIYEGCTITVLDVTDGHYESRLIADWSDGARAVTVDEPLGFTPAAADSVWIWSFYFPRSVFQEFPLPRQTTLLNVDRRATDVTPGTKTLDPQGREL